jgi:hypothetical protein
VPSHMRRTAVRLMCEGTSATMRFAEG